MIKWGVVEKYTKNGRFTSSMKNVTDYKFRQKTNFMVLRKMNT